MNGNGRRSEKLEYALREWLLYVAMSCGSPQRIEDWCAANWRRLGYPGRHQLSSTLKYRLATNPNPRPAGRDAFTGKVREGRLAKKYADVVNKLKSKALVAIFFLLVTVVHARPEHHAELWISGYADCPYSLVDMNVDFGGGRVAEETRSIPYEYEFTYSKPFCLVCSFMPHDGSYEDIKIIVTVDGKCVGKKHLHGRGPLHWRIDLW